MDVEVITAEEFAALDAETKGFVVYLCGELDEQPHVPSKFNAPIEDQEAYAKGEARAILSLLDAS